MMKYTASYENYNICIFSCKQDKKFVDEFRFMLKPLEASSDFTVTQWIDQAFSYRENTWRMFKYETLITAKVAVLLVSVDFLSSDFILNQVLPAIFESADRNEIKIFWVRINECLYEETEFYKYKPCHDINITIDMLNPSKRRKIWSLICRKIRIYNKENNCKIYDFKFDKNFLIEHNLQCEITKFINQLKTNRMQGIFLFSIIGDRYILFNYIVERLKREISRIRGRRTYTCEKKQFNISFSNLETIHSEIEREIIQIAKEDYIFDSIIFLWRSEEVPLERIKYISKSLYSRLSKNEIYDLLNKKKRCIILLWSSSNRDIKEIDNLEEINIPNQIEDLDFFIQRTSNYMNDMKVEDNEIEYFLKSLRKTEGSFFESYKIIDGVSY